MRCYDALRGTIVAFIQVVILRGIYEHGAYCYEMCCSYASSHLQRKQLRYLDHLISGWGRPPTTQPSLISSPATADTFSGLLIRYGLTGKGQSILG